MKLLLALERAFINFFGITKPTPARERQAAWFIGLLLLFIALGMLGVLMAFLHVRR